MVSAVSVYAKHRLSQVNVRQNLYATGFTLPVIMTGNYCQMFNDVIGKNIKYK